MNLEESENLHVETGRCVGCTVRSSEVLLGSGTSWTSEQQIVKKSSDERRAYAKEDRTSASFLEQGKLSPRSLQESRFSIKTR